MAVIAAAAFLLLLVSTSTAGAITEDRPHATVYTVEVQQDGNATWTIQLRYRLIGQSEIDSFESVEEDFENGNLTVFEGIEDELGPFAEEAANRTERPMELSDFERNVRIRETLTLTEGIVSVTFNWSNFAAVNGSVVRVGDVFAGGGLALAEDERLVVEHVDGLPVTSVAPEPDTQDDQRLVWDGELFFEEGQPQVVYGEPPQTNGDNTSDGNGSTGDGTEQRNGSPTAATLLAGVFVLVSGFAGGFYLSRSGFVGGGVEKEDATEPEKEEPVEEDLLSDEDRVVHILRDNGGKMKQAEIVEQTDWSKSKVSMLLSDMADEGTVSKLRLGRENVIELEDSDGDG
jgi:hypothetical protein